jgi:twitching motility protein PilI
MSDTNTVNPVAALKEIEDLCRGCETGMSRKAEISNEWSGIAFQLGKDQLLAPMDDVVEILDYPEISVVPLTQSWVRGIANVRGNLLPIIDLNGYLGNEMPRVTNKTRVLVVDCNGVHSGIVVDEVLGLKHFLEEELTREAPAVEDGLKPYLQHGFRRGGQVWGVFNLMLLVDSPAFLQVAV